MTTTSPSEPAKTRSMFDLWLGTGMWAEVKSDRGGQRCASQVQQGATLRAYFDAGGQLVAMTATDQFGERTELAAAEVLQMAAIAARAMEAESTPGRPRRFTRRR